MLKLSDDIEGYEKGLAFLSALEEELF
jgi:hypothetical protein